MQLSGTTGNTIRNNIIGQSPRGETVPMAGWGIYFRDHTSFNTIVGNIIHNTANGGIGLLEFNVRNITDQPEHHDRYEWPGDLPGAQPEQSRATAPTG